MVGERSLVAIGPIADGAPGSRHFGDEALRPPSSIAEPSHDRGRRRDGGGALGCALHGQEGAAGREHRRVEPASGGEQPLERAAKAGEDGLVRADQLGRVGNARNDKDVPVGRKEGRGGGGLGNDGHAQLDLDEAGAPCPVPDESQAVGGETGPVQRHGGHGETGNGDPKVRGLLNHGRGAEG